MRGLFHVGITPYLTLRYTYHLSVSRVGCRMVNHNEAIERRNDTETGHECGEAVTIYHARHTVKGNHEDMSEDEIRETFDVHWRVGRDEHDVTPEEFAAHYAPAETVTGTTDLEEAWRAAQGHVVNKEQGGRHMVCSAQVGDVFLVHHEDGTHTYHVAEGVGFRELETLTAEAEP